MKKKTILGIIVAIAFCLISGFAIYTGHKANNSYQSLRSSDQVTTMNHYQKQNKITIAIYYNHKCPDCLSVQSLVVPLVKQEKTKNDYNYIAFDKLNKTDYKFFKTSNIKHTPTFAVYYKNNIIYQYTGTDKPTIKKILKGINPINDKTFKENLKLYRTK